MNPTVVLLPIFSSGILGRCLVGGVTIMVEMVLPSLDSLLLIGGDGETSYNEPSRITGFKMMSTMDTRLG